jgi:hypothetical protein
MLVSHNGGIPLMVVFPSGIPYWKGEKEVDGKDD